MNTNYLISDVDKTIALIIMSIPIIITIALIIAIFYIANRQSRQDKGQDIIINLLKEIRDNQIELLEETKYYNDTQSYDDNFYNDKPPIE